jgi:hypothetical protein
MKMMCLRINKKKIWKKYIFCILKVLEERSRSRSWFRIRIHYSEGRIRIRLRILLFSDIMLAK